MTKIFGIGLNKTGTKTLGECFKILGYNHKSYDYELLEKLFNGEKENVLKITEKFDSFEDWPWPLLYKELYDKYPDAKFILTIRKTPEIWFESLCKHSIRTGPTLARKFVYGFEMPQHNKKEHIEFYNKHNFEVINYFSNKPNRLLIACWENGNAWKEISDFLKLPTPLENFPHENKSMC